MRIAVAGGTGTVGRLVVEEVQRAGHEAVVLARSTGVDLSTGAGLESALHGCQAVIDVSNTPARTRQEAEEFFSAVTEHLLEASTRAGVTHLVVLSIVGADIVDLDYYFGKRRQEEIVAAAAVPWTVLRATQFHEFAEQMLAGSEGPVARIPRMLSQPVAAAEVAQTLVELAVGAPQGFARPLAGPEQLWVVDMARQVLRRRGSRQPVEPLEIDGPVGAQLAGGGLLPKGDFVQGRETFAQYLAEN
jgi:uncharacterized protein YbjT (DUF2867 family)